MNLHQISDLNMECLEGGSSSRVKNIGLLLLVFLVIEFSPKIGTVIANHYQHLFAFIDPDKTFSWEIIHHIIQMVVPLSVMLIWPKRPLKEWGFRIGDSQKGLKWIVGFTLIWVGIYMVITFIYVIQKSSPQVYYDVTSTRNLLGEIGFRSLIVGLSEETLFRAFPITILIVFLNRQVSIFHFKVSQAGIVATIFFVYAHIGYYLFPFHIVHLNIVQLFMAAGLGLLYAIVFEETKSILYPMIIHSISDVIPVLSVFLLQIINH